MLRLLIRRGRFHIAGFLAFEFSLPIRFAMLFRRLFLRRFRLLRQLSRRLRHDFRHAIFAFFRYAIYDSLVSFIMSAIFRCCCFQLRFSFAFFSP